MFERNLWRKQISEKPSDNPDTAQKIVFLLKLKSGYPP